MLCVCGLQGRSFHSNESTERQHRLLVTSEHKELDQAEVIGSPGGEQLMQEEPVPEDRTSPVLGSSVRRVPKGQTSDSDVVTECNKPAIIISSWKLLSSLLHQEPDVALLYLVNTELYRNAEQMGK